MLMAFLKNLSGIEVSMKRRVKVLPEYSLERLAMSVSMKRRVKAKALVSPNAIKRLIQFQ